ncbi:MAG: 23S rRNA (guanosine(2251)-2'-O)-methyltransferase RlmB [Oscillospiraceae bacterium]|nr:23S rRNA (guanosine(2251)-2'-O)-methyltransferase RlmB [Oscillospiraceae bacterium]
MAYQRFDKNKGKNGGKKEYSSKPRSYGRPEKGFEEPERNIPDAADREAAEGLIVGRNPVMEALKSGKAIDTIYVNSDAGGSIGAITRIAREKGIVIKNVNDQKLTQMCAGASHQGIIASGACAEYVSVEDILNISKKKGTAPFIIICDEIEDPHNLGAIIRTAETAGADGVIIPKRRSAGLTAIVGKASAGAAEHMAIARVPNIPAVLKELKDKGLWVYGAAAGGSNGLWDTDFTGAMALVIGSEGDGIGRLVRENCDFIVNIPMVGKINSLNASAAASVIMYEVLRQRSGR